MSLDTPFGQTAAVMKKGVLLKSIRIVAGIAAVGFFLMPLRTFTQVLLCVGSLAIAMMFSAVSGFLDDKNTGYWPNKPQLAKSIRLVNVPSVAYYKHGKLIAVLIGEKQDVRSRLERILRGESIARDDGVGGVKALVRQRG